MAKGRVRKLDAMEANIERNIALHGRSIIGVFPNAGSKDPVNEAFAYTIGNAIKGLPELLIVGMYEDTYTLNRLSSMMLERGKKFADGELVLLGEGARVPVCVVDASDAVKDRYTFQASNYHGGEDYAVMQVVVPDTHGLFPWQPGCSRPYADVKVYRTATRH